MSIFRLRGVHVKHYKNTAAMPPERMPIPKTIVLPMSMPIIGTLAILKIIGNWNNFVGPLLYIRDSNRQMLSVALLHLEGEYTRNWGELMAGYTIASLPLIVLFLFCMRLFVKGLTAGAVKG